MGHAKKRQKRIHFPQMQGEGCAVNNTHSSHLQSQTVLETFCKSGEGRKHYVTLLLQEHKAEGKPEIQKAALFCRLKIAASFTDRPFYA